MSNLLILPVALPLATAIVLVLLRGSLVWSRLVAGASTLATSVGSVLLAADVAENGTRVLRPGDWPTPFGICFVADGLAVAMVVMTMAVSSAVLFFSFRSVDDERQSFFFFAFFQVLLAGVNGAFLTGDLFNLFVWFEVFLIASYVLMAIGGGGYQLQETFKYLVLNTIGSAFFIAAVAATYGLTGTVNMADLAVRWREIDAPALQNGIALTFLFVFGLKAAIFPLYVWMPRAYYAPPTAVSALFGGLLTKVGVYAIFRTYTLVFVHDTPFTHGLLLWIAALTMFIGVLGAVSQNDIKRILSFHIVSQIGYMIMGIALYTPLAVAAGVYYIVHNMVAKTALFLVGGAVESVTGTTHLKRLGGLVGVVPVLATLFLVSALALAGVPPFSGFVSKLTLIRAGFEVEAWAIVATSLVVSFLTLFSMIKIYRFAFWGAVRAEVGPRETKPTDAPSEAMRGLLGPIAFLGALAIVLGVLGEFFLGVAMGISAELLEPDRYINAVLGGGGS